MTSLAVELGMADDDESCDNNSRSRGLLPAQDSCEVDSLPEERGKQGVLPPGESLCIFYRAMHFSAKRGIAIACRLSVCLSVRNVEVL